MLVTRVDLVAAAAAVDVPGAEHDERARLLTWRPAAAGDFTVAVVTAGTSDGPVADETAAIARRHRLAGAGDPRRRGRRRPSRCWVTRRLSAAGWPGETVTPTGAALPRALVCQYGPPSAMTIRGTRIRRRNG